RVRVHEQHPAFPRGQDRPCPHPLGRPAPRPRDAKHSPQRIGEHAVHLESSPVLGPELSGVPTPKSFWERNLSSPPRTTHDRKCTSYPENRLAAKGMGVERFEEITLLKTIMGLTGLHRGRMSWDAK